MANMTILQSLRIPSVADLGKTAIATIIFSSIFFTFARFDILSINMAVSISVGGFAGMFAHDMAITPHRMGAFKGLATIIAFSILCNIFASILIDLFIN